MPLHRPNTTELGRARKAFFDIDKDGSGSIDMDELKKMMRNLGQDQSDAELAELVKSVDENNDGLIQLREFLLLYTRGIDNKFAVGSQDVNNCYAAFGGDPRDVNSHVTAEHIREQMLEMFDLDFDCAEAFNTPRGTDVSKSDFETLLTTVAPQKEKASNNRTASFKAVDAAA